ncbi:monovalent cation/H+ antiporter complex subunit F [Streptomyces platensis]|uniref:monovalent cation/H+ antiporter complex subunit F n=1 Tax=Streptomyces platensis TaxID=58346 RepID=UPI003F5D97D3
MPAQNLATTLLSLVILLLAQGYGRPAYTDPALVLAVLGPAGTLLYVRLLADQLAAHPPRPRSLLAVTALSYTAVPAVVLPLRAGVRAGAAVCGVHAGGGARSGPSYARASGWRGERCGRSPSVSPGDPGRRTVRRTSRSPYAVCRMAGAGSARRTSMPRGAGAGRPAAEERRVRSS